MSTTNSRMPRGKAPVSQIKSYVTAASHKTNAKIVTSRHNPNKIIITNDFEENKEAMRVHKLFNTYNRNKYAIQNDNDYFNTREQSIIEEMQLKLSQNDFEDWYAHHLGLSDDSDSSYYSDSSSNYEL